MTVTALPKPRGVASGPIGLLLRRHNDAPVAGSPPCRLACRLLPSRSGGELLRSARCRYRQGSEWSNVDNGCHSVRWEPEKTEVLSEP